MKIKIYHHDEIVSPEYNEAPNTLPEGILFDGSHHRLVWKVEAKELNLSETENDQAAFWKDVEFTNEKQR